MMNTKVGAGYESVVGNGPVLTPSSKSSPSTLTSDSRRQNNYYVNNSAITPSNNNHHTSKHSFSNGCDNSVSSDSTITPPTLKSNFKFFNGNSSNSDSENFSSRNSHKVKVPQLTFSPETPPALPTVPPPPLEDSRSSPFFINSTNVSNGLNHSRSGSSANNSLIDIDTEQMITSSPIVNKSHSHSSGNSTEENFECFGEGTESFLDSTSENTSLQYVRDASDLSVPDIAGGGSNSHPSISRNSWQRTSLRKSPQNNGESMGHRRWGSFRNTPGTKRTAVTSSNALANQLYRSSSFHSSGRSSAGDGEEMYSDGSLEDEVIDLTQKVHHLEEKFTVLAENQNDVDDRYTRSKQENAELSTKLFMLEEQLRDVEMRADEKLRDEQRRHKESYTRLEREKQLQIENYDIRLHSLEKDLGSSKTEINSELDSFLSVDASDLSVPDVAGGGSNSHPSISRNSWQRTSLRKSPQNNGESMGHRRWGSFRNTPGTKRTAVTSSNALANQLYRSSSFHSSGRSSAGDGEEMYSDGSLEDEVIDLTQKVHHLEEKFTVLAENQNDVDDRYTRSKQENAELSTKLFMLEEQLRDVEMRADEKLRDEQRRHKESYTRLEREKQLQIENYDIRLHSLEKDLGSSKTEINRFKVQVERERGEKNHLSDKVSEYEKELANLRDQNKTLIEQSRKDRDAQALESAGSQQALLDLKKEFESLRRYQMENTSSSLRRHESTDSECGELKSRLREYEEEIKRLKKQNQHLQETNDELSAQILNHGLEEGRHLLTLNSSVPMGNSLAAEFEAMSHDQTVPGFHDHSNSDIDFIKMQTALKEQKDVNDQLRNYIDGILLTIVENYPQLLEVKNKSSDSSSGSSSGCMSMTEN